MPIYVFKCNTCEEMWEDNLPYEARNLPTEGHCSLSPHLGETVPCYGIVSRISQDIKLEEYNMECNNYKTKNNS
tara:strand:+ start:5412 stop:5633 length:222 start_codon:yes stop_codon:yes gene_type:complete